MDLSKHLSSGINETIRTYSIEQNFDEACVYKLMKEKSVVLLVLYINDILLMKNNIGLLSYVKNWLTEQFQMKNLGETSYVFIK